MTTHRRQTMRTVSADAGRPSEGGAGGDDPLAPLDETDARPGRLAVPAGSGRDIARDDTRMTEAIPDGTAAEPGHADTAPPSSDPVRRSSEQQRAIGVVT
jgi:hypothetical protein